MMESKKTPTGEGQQRKAFIIYLASAHHTIAKDR
jgi:hypothetical protein